MSLFLYNGSLNKKILIKNQTNKQSDLYQSVTKMTWMTTWWKWFIQIRITTMAALIIMEGVSQCSTLCGKDLFLSGSSIGGEQNRLKKGRKVSKRNRFSNLKRKLGGCCTGSDLHWPGRTLALLCCGVLWALNTLQSYSELIWSLQEELTSKDFLLQSAEPKTHSESNTKLFEREPFYLFNSHYSFEFAALAPHIVPNLPSIDSMLGELSLGIF